MLDDYADKLLPFGKHVNYSLKPQFIKAKYCKFNTLGSIFANINENGE
jgi:hypothetical protein